LPWFDNGLIILTYQSIIQHQGAEVNIVRIKAKSQIVIPKEIRSLLGWEEGDELILDVKDRVLEIAKKPHSYTESTRGLGDYVWEGVDIEDYVRGERESWGTKGKDSRRTSSSTKP